MLSVCRLMAHHYSSQGQVQGCAYSCAQDVRLSAAGFLCFAFSFFSPLRWELEFLPFYFIWNNVMPWGCAFR